MIGKELVNEYKDSACITYGVVDDKILEYMLGLDTRKIEYKFGGETPMEYGVKWLKMIIL
ncbi:MAG: hypothetical protein Q4F98_05660 [Lachnospiraceae bacterium]|nr:hypothetical protein [Lachnospiraceae bacterium]